MVPNRQNEFLGRRLGWGQFIRWLDPRVETHHYHEHAATWPDVRKTMWLQWTASPPSVADLDGDGATRSIGLPERGMKEPYETQAYAFMVLDGAQGGGAQLGAPPPGLHNVAAGRASRRYAAGDWYPPCGIPAPTVVDISGDRRPEIVAPRCPTASSMRWARRDGGSGATTTPTGGAKTFASEVVAADLNRDGTPGARLRHLRARRRARGGSSCSPRRARSSSILAKNLIAAPLHFQFVLGVPGGVGASERALDAMVAEMATFPAGATWAVAAVGRHQLPMADLAIRRGGHARVGLEDNVFVDKGVLAKGLYELVERAAAFAHAAGREIATPAVARRLLGLST